MSSTRPDGALELELLTTGPNAHGYGTLSDGRNFAFRVRNRKARLEIYRVDADATEPLPADVELLAERHTASMNLDSTRSLTALLRTLAVAAEPVTPEDGARVDEHERTLRAYFLRMETILGTWSA